MPDRWSEDRNRREREGRSESDWRGGDRWSGREGRSFEGEGARLEGPGRDRVFGERETGVEYNSRNPPRPAGGGGGAGVGPDYQQSYGRGGQREDFGRPPAWQDRDYTGESPASKGGYEADRNARQFQSQDYTGGGRFYGDDSRQPLYREEYGQGGREYGPAPRGYDAGRGQGRDQHQPSGREIEQRYASEMRRPVSGGTGGYDFDERGYGDGGRGGWERPEYHGVSRDADRDDGDRGEERGRGGDFLQRVGSWFGNAVGEVRRDFGGDREPRRYSADFNREARWSDPGHRGRGPKGYQRSDDRISDEVHQRLTDDPWTDASNISVSVSGGEVTLSGTVENREAKHRAERCVEEIAGVAHVQNNLRVDRGGFLTSPSKGFGDSVLESKMREDETGGGSQSTEDSAASRTTTRRT